MGESRIMEMRRRPSPEARYQVALFPLPVGRRKVSSRVRGPLGIKKTRELPFWVSSRVSRIGPRELANSANTKS